MDALHLSKRYTGAKGNWETWRALADEAYAFSQPNINPYPQNSVEGVKKNTQCYDITGNISTRRLVSKLNGNLTPDGQPWFALEAGEEIQDDEERKALNKWLQVFTDIILSTMSQSNFYVCMNEVYQDLVLIIGAMMIEPCFDSHAILKCKSVKCDTIYPEANAYDEIKTVWRDFNQIYGRDINMLWAKAELTYDMEERLKDDPMAKFDLVEGVVYDEEKRDYRTVVFQQNCQNNDEYLLDVRSKSSPWIVGRWSKTSAEVGGRGPVIEALPTIRSLNMLVSEIMRNVALSTSPPWMAASDGVFNAEMFTIEPNKIIPISRQSMGEVPLQRLDVASDINMGNLEVNYMATQVKECLYDTPMRPIDSPQQTATEVLMRAQQTQEEMGPAFSRMGAELFAPIINRVIFLCQQAGRLPKDLVIDNKTITISYKSPLLKSADLQKLQALQNYVAVMQPLLGPELTIGSLNLDKLPQWVGEMLSLDAGLTKSPAEVANLIQQMQQASQPQSPAANQPSATAGAMGQIQNQQAQGVAANG